MSHEWENPRLRGSKKERSKYLTQKETKDTGPSPSTIALGKLEIVKEYFEPDEYQRLRAYLLLVKRWVFYDLAKLIGATSNWIMVRDFTEVLGSKEAGEDYSRLISKLDALDTLRQALEQQEK